MPEEGPERHINIHFAPELMAGMYANFANVSHSDYEFTITFARVDHEVEDDEIPGVVVGRVNLSARFMRELIDAMEDDCSRWRTARGHQGACPRGRLLRLANASGLSDPLQRRGVRPEQELDASPAGPGRPRSGRRSAAGSR